MTVIKGYPSQEKLDASQQEAVTVLPAKNGQHGMDVVSNGAVTLITTDAVEAGSTTTVINATAHSAEVGDVIRFTTGGVLFPREMHVVDTTANTITLHKPAPQAPGTGDPFDILRFMLPTVSASGGAPTEVAFQRDGGSQVVTEDTAVTANNRPLPTKIFSDAGNPAAFGAGTVSTGTVRTTPASDSPHLLATRHEAVGTPLSGRLSDGTDFISSQAVAASQTTAATLTKALATLGVALGWDGTTHREIAVSTTGGVTLNARHETVGTPLAARLSDGTDFIGSEAIAAAQKTLATETAVLSTLGVVLGWDGATHRELAVDTTGSAKTVAQTTAGSLPARGKILGTALTGSYQTVFTAAANLALLYLINSCNQPIMVSLDTGVTDHFELDIGESVTIDLGSNNKHYASGGVIQAKHAGVVPTSGSIRVSAVA